MRSLIIINDIYYHDRLRSWEIYGHNILRTNISINQRNEKLIYISIVPNIDLFLFKFKYPLIDLLYK